MSEAKKYKVLMKNTALLTLSSFGSKLLAFFLVPLYTNVLTTSEYGTADIITTSAMLLMYVCTMNIGTAVLRFGLDRSEKTDKVFFYGIRVLVIGLFVVAAGTLGAFLLNIVPWPKYSYLFLVFIFFADSSQTIMYYYLRAVDKVKIMAIASLIETFVRLITNLVALLVLRWGLIGYLLSLVLGPLSGALYALIHLLPIEISEKDPAYERKLHREMRRYAIPSVASQLAWWVNNSLDKYFVLGMKGASLNGIYAVSYKLPGIMAMLCNIFGQAWGISAIQELDPKDKDGFFANTYRIFHSGLVLSCSALILLNIPISRILYAKDFFEAWRYSSVLILAMLFSGLSTFLGGIFNAAKRNTVLAVTTMIAAMVNVVLNAVLIPPYGAMGASVATMVSFYVAWMSRLVASRKSIVFHIALVRDHIVYALIILQIILEHIQGHVYLGQIAIFIAVLVLNKSEMMSIVDKAASVIRRYIGKNKDSAKP